MDRGPFVGFHPQVLSDNTWDGRLGYTKFFADGPCAGVRISLYGLPH